MERLTKCPPSFALESLVTEDETSDDAESGTRIHKALESGDYSRLTPSEEETAEMCDAQSQRLLIDWLGSHEDSADSLTREQRLGLTVFGSVIDATPESRAKFIVTGQADLVAIVGAAAIVIDYKTGRNETPAAQDNAQLATLAVLVAKRYKCKHVRVAIVQPWAGKPTVADYDLEALDIARVWLLETLQRAEVATLADRRAGDWCHYCKARFGCNTFRETNLLQIEAVDPISIAGLDGKEQRAAMFARAMELPNQKLVALMRGLKMVRRYADSIEAAFKSRVEAGEMPGFRTETKPGNREITDAEKAFAALSELGVTSEDVLAACSLPIGPMQDAVRKRSGIKSQTEKRTTYNLTAKQAAEAVEEALTRAGALKRAADKTVIVEEFLPD
jgi:CRISPR/Cas system-associated exonuclease Cas4 (RecB family)